MDNNKKIRKLRKTNEKQGKPRPMENTELVRKIGYKTNGKARKTNGKPMENKGQMRQMKEKLGKWMNTYENQRKRRNHENAGKLMDKNKEQWWKNKGNVRNQWKMKETCQGKNKENEGTQKEERTRREKQWKKEGNLRNNNWQTTKMVEDHWERKENKGKPLKKHPKPFAKKYSKTISQPNDIL